MVEIEELVNKVRKATLSEVDKANLERLICESYKDYVDEIKRLVRASDPTITDAQLDAAVPKTIDIDHVFAIDPKVVQTPDGKLYIKVGGFHLDPSGVVGASGLIDVIQRVEDPNSCARIVFDFAGSQGFEKTQFPNNWTSEQVVLKVLEALKNLVDAKFSRGHLAIEGVTNEGITIRIVIEEGGCIKTVYPLIKEII